MRRYKLKSNIWYIRRYKGDGALYALCRCGYKYPCYRMNDHFKVTLGYTYPYCPQCGERKQYLYMRDDIKEKYYDRDN